MLFAKLSYSCVDAAVRLERVMWNIVQYRYVFTVISLWHTCVRYLPTS